MVDKKKKKKINPKTGQIFTEELAEDKEGFEPLKPPRKPTFNVGAKEVSKEAFEGVRALSTSKKGGTVTPEARELAKTPEQKRREEAATVIQEKGIFEEQLPENVELDYERTGVEKAPVVGPSLGAFANIGQQAAIKALGMDDDPRKIQPLIQDPETLREMALQEIQQDVIDKGTTASEKFGALIEAIPIIGPQVGKWAGSLIEDPKSNVDTLFSIILLVFFHP